MTVTAVPFIDLERAYAAHAQEFERCLLDVARSGTYILGPRVAELEQAVAGYLGVSHAVAVGSGSDALLLALMALDIGPGDEVITTPFTFAATVEAIQHTGATAVLVDIDPDTYNIDPAAVERAITSNTRALLPVHMFGLPANMPRIMEIAGSHNLAVVEDCAQSLGSHIDGRAAGAFGSASAFSFYPTKTLGSLGDAGMIATGDDQVERRLRQLRNHGDDGRGEYVRLGFNSRLDEMQAAVVSIKLEHLDDMNARRQRIAAQYNEVLAGTVAKLPVATAAAEHVYGYYTIGVPDRDNLRGKLREAGIATALYYARPLHRQPVFADSCRFDELPNAEAAAGRCLSLPIFPEMTDDEIDYVAATTADLIR